MKDHEVAQFVNELTAIAKEYGSTQQLRERISKSVKSHLKPTCPKHDTGGGPCYCSGAENES